MLEDGRSFREVLIAIEAKLDKHIEADNIRRPANEKRLTNVERQVYGNGKPGLLTDVDRLKQRAKLLAVAAAILATAIAGVWAKQLWPDRSYLRSAHKAAQP